MKGTGRTLEMMETQAKARRRLGKLQSSDKGPFGKPWAAKKKSTLEDAADSKDAVLLVTLPPVSYTGQVSGADNGTGQALVEVYEIP